MTATLSGTFAGGRFHPINPLRITDSRSKLGVAGPLGKNQSVTISAPASVADNNTMALAMNVTAVSPSASTYLSFWPGGQLPKVSTLNPAAGQTVANAAITMIDSNADTFAAYNNVGTTGLLVDVAGYYEFDPNTFTGNAQSAGITPAVQSAGQHHSPAATTPHVKFTK